MIADRELDRDLQRGWQFDLIRDRRRLKRLQARWVRDEADDLDIAEKFELLLLDGWIGGRHMSLSCYRTVDTR